MRNVNLKDRIKFIGSDFFLNKSKTFCILPWMHMYVNTDSSVWSCCVNKTMTKETHGFKTNIMTQPIEEIINNDYFKQLRLAKNRMGIGPRSKRSEIICIYLPRHWRRRAH